MELFRYSLGWNVALARPDNVLNIEQDNLLRGIDKCSGTARSVVQVRLKALDQSHYIEVAQGDIFMKQKM